MPGWIDLAHLLRYVPGTPDVTAASKWIAPDYTNNCSCPSGGYTYTLNFNLPGSLNPATATISGRWAADNEAFMYLNATPVPVSDGGGDAQWSYGFAQWTYLPFPPAAVLCPAPTR